MGKIVSSTIDASLRVYEQITGVPGASAEMAVVHNAWRMYTQRLADNLETEDKFAAVDYTLGGSATAIDLRAVPFTQGTCDFTGLGLGCVLIKAPSTNTGDITLAPAASNAYPLPGSASLKIKPGGERLKWIPKPLAVTGSQWQLSLSGTSGDVCTVSYLAIAVAQGATLVSIPTARSGLGRIDGGTLTQLSQVYSTTLQPRGWLERVQIDWIDDVSLTGPSNWDDLTDGEYAGQSPTLRQLRLDLRDWYEAAVPGSFARSGYLAPQSWQSEWASLASAEHNRYPLTVVALRPPLTTFKYRVDDGVLVGVITEAENSGGYAQMRTSADHGLAVNDLVQVLGVNSDYDGRWRVRSITSSTRFVIDRSFTVTVGTVAAGSFRGLTEKRVDLSIPSEAALAADAAVAILNEQVQQFGLNHVWLDELYDDSIGQPDPQQDFVSINGPWYRDLANRLRGIGLRVGFNMATRYESSGTIRRAYQQAGTGNALFECVATHGLKPGDTVTVSGNPRPELNGVHTLTTGTAFRTLATLTPLTSGTEGLGGKWQSNRTPHFDLLTSADTLITEGFAQQNYCHRDIFYQMCLNIRYVLSRGTCFYHIPRFFSISAPRVVNVGISKQSPTNTVRLTTGTDTLALTHDKLGVVGHSANWNGPRLIKDFGQTDINVSGVVSNGGNAQFTTTTAHGLVVNEKVRILTGPYAGERTVLSVESTTQLTLNVSYTATATDKLRVYFVDLYTPWNASPGAGSGGRIVLQRWTRPITISSIAASAGAGSPWRVTCTEAHRIFPEASPWVVIYGQSGTFTEGTEYNVAAVSGQPTQFDVVGTSATGSTLTGGVVFDARCDRRYLALLMTLIGESDARFFVQNGIGTAMADWATLPAQLGAPTQPFAESLITYDADGYAQSMTRTFERGSITIYPRDRWGEFTIT